MVLDQVHADNVQKQYHQTVFINGLPSVTEMEKKEHAEENIAEGDGKL